MKIFSAIFVLILCFSFSFAEIEPRFPGNQPIAIPGAPQGAISIAPVTENQFEIADIIIIDDFIVDTSPLVVVQLLEDVPPSISSFAADQDSSIIGGERDILLTVNSGPRGVAFGAGAVAGKFTIATPNNAAGVILLQYDGIDLSPNLDTARGLGGLDFSAGAGFRLVALSDYDTEFTMKVADTFGRTSTATKFVPGGAGEQEYFVSFDSFSFIDFASVSAVEFEIQAFDNVDFVINIITVYGEVPVPPEADCFRGTVLPCDFDYYRLGTFDGVDNGDYLYLSYNAIGTSQNVNATGRFYVVTSDFTDLQSELATNDNIIDTLGELPGPNNYEFQCTENCEVEMAFSLLRDTTYYLAVEGRGDGVLRYQICYSYRNVGVIPLLDGIPETIFFDQIPTYPPNHRTLEYRYFSLEVPETNFSEGSYLVVNVSRAEPFPGVGLRVMFGSLPQAPIDTGVIDSTDFNSQGSRSDNTIYPSCVDTSGDSRPEFDHPVSTDPRIPCDCFTDVQLFGDGPSFQLTCQLVVDPCAFRYGTWFMSIELPERSQPSNPLDRTGRTNYTITATTVSPPITILQRNVTYKSFVEPQAYTHFKIDVPSNQVISGESHLLVHLSNVRNGFVDVFVHKGDGQNQNLAGGLESCVPADATCRTCDACNVVIEKCNFEAGTWYVSVGVSYENEEFLVNDPERLPMTFTLRATWMEDPVPQRLIAGAPVAKYVGEALYDFYVIDVPPTIDTWLFIELFAKANDTEVVLAVLHGDIPGGECYERPDFYCVTGDARGERYSTGNPSFLNNDHVQRESCSFMIQTCELSPGPLFISVYGHHTGYAAYGDTTFYQVPVHYTLWADFDVALSLKNAVSYSETVFEKQYQHYYIRADQVRQGSSLTVEVTNIRHGTPQTIEAFVNYNYLAGNCPCYDHLYNCTGAQPCGSSIGALPDVESVLNCCTMIVPSSDFRPGVWYIAVLGVNEDYVQYTTPIGYTLTATVHDAPTFLPLILGQAYQGEVPQWNKTLEYVNFRLGADSIPLNDLVFKATYVQNCEFKGKHDDLHNPLLRDTLWMYVNKGAPATEYVGGYQQRCKIDTSTQSYCTIVIPHCEWEGDDWFVAIQGRYEADFIGRFTLRASTDEVRDYQLKDGISHYNRVSVGRHQHYFIETRAEEDQYLSIDLYTNQDQDFVSVYLMKDERAGSSPCFNHFASCVTQSCCTWQLHACDLEAGRYYISVFGSHSQFYDNSVEYTLTASHKPVTTLLFNGDPFTGHLKQVGDVNHYRFEVPSDIQLGTYLLFEVDNVKHGAVTAYGQSGFLAGRCPCFIWEHSCTASADPFGPAGSEWCEIRVPSCQLEPGEYFFSVWGIENQTPDPPVFLTPIGYTLEVNLIAPVTVDPFVAVRRNIANTEPFQAVSNGRYNHYEFSMDDDDYESGNHVIVEITSVRDGALFVYYNQFVPGDQAKDCHIAEICTSGLGAGTECYWQIPFCLTRPLDGAKHYITVEGRTGRIQASYNILIWKQGAPSFSSNDAFTLDNAISVGSNNEIDIIHEINHEPNGWTQFMRLNEVPSRLDEGRGEILEVFFYRVTANPGEDMSFNVYLFPNVPAGAHECCDVSNPPAMGSCQGAPCSSSADTTTSSNNGPDVFSHTCSLGSGVGSDGSGDPLFGERCTVRVWPCEFNKYCGDTTTDWFLSVVPLGAADTNRQGAGLQYSVQWRVRDLRATTAQTIGSVDLTDNINTYQFTREYSVISSNTESQGWLSFFVDFEQRTEARLSIQTLFTEGDGVVYINGGEFAAHTSACNDYECSSSPGACAGSERFYVSECCASKHDRYYITIRNTGIVGSTTSVQFRIVETSFPRPIQIREHPGENGEFVATSRGSVYPGVTGVAGDSYDFYVLTIDDDDLDRHQSWVVEVARPTGVNLDAGELDVYIRYGAAPGQFGFDNAQTAFGLTDEGCHGWQYSCNAAEPGSRCLWQIPHCDLIEGHWWIAIGNPNFDFNGTPTNLPDYTLTTFLSEPPLHLELNEQASSRSDTDIGLLQHFSFNITADELDFDDREEFKGYWVKFLRFQLDGIASGETATMYINYGGLAGPDGETCLDNVREITCTGSCFVDITPCELDGDNLKLKTGVYYASVSHTRNTGFSIIARVYRDSYSQLQLSETVTGTGNRLGAVDDFYQYTVTDTELEVDGDGDGNYRYVIDISGEFDDDDLADNEYFVFNFTASPFAANTAPVHFDVFRDDCTRYACDLLGPRSWCTIDALELAPCSAKAGRFFIRAENPLRVQFTLNLYHNETVVQTIQNTQKITEIVYPYEYQEYFYEPEPVNEGATLAFTICSICGDVEAFIRPDLPAGPVPDYTGNENSCSIDSCRATGPDDTTFEPENNCCQLFLDTCQFEQRSYYVGIRGVNTVYPNERNENLYLPAKYSIQAVQTAINVTDLSFASCPKTVNYYTSWARVPRQYAIDVESINVGGMLRLSMRLPTEFATANSPATLYVQANQTVGYSDGCPLDGEYDSSLSCSTSSSCDFIIPYCKLEPYGGGRYYIWADAPRGTEILVERWDPIVPLLHHDVAYHSSINAPGPAVAFDTPFQPNRQIYRFDLDPRLYEDASYYEKFFVRVIVSDVQQGQLSFTVNSGHSPYVPNSGCGEPMFLDTTSCSSVGQGNECWVELQYANLIVLAGGNPFAIPHSFWLTVNGVSQDCELHSIKYQLTVQTNWLITYYPVGETTCNVVEENYYNFHRLRPREVENPQESVLRIQLSDVDVNESVNLFVHDGSLANSFQYHLNVPSDASGNIDLHYICGYQNLYMSVFGSESVDGSIDYRLSAEKVPVVVKDLFDDSIYYADDDDDDACPHPHDFYRFETSGASVDGSFFRVLVDSEFPTQVYVNKNDFAWTGCADSGYGENNPEETGTTSLNVYDFCGFRDGTYFITVVSEGPYYIYTDVRDDVQELTLGEVFRDSVEPGMYQMYTLDICDGWTEADDRLVIEISDADNGDVYGWVRRDGNPGNPTEFGYNTCSQGSAFADYGANESGYDFLLVNHCDLETGHYHILIRGSPHEGAPERNCEHINFRLFPYLIDYQIDPIQLLPNVPIQDAVDFWTINRIIPGSVPFANYYSISPLQDASGFFEGVTQAVARLSNVEGGLLHLRVMCDHLAVSEFGYIDGEIYGLVSNSADDIDFDSTHDGLAHDGLIRPGDKMQSGRFPFNYQNIMDHRNSRLQPECDGCSDFCCEMTYDDLDQYTKDSSCAIWIPSCYLVFKDLYLSVEPVLQYSQDHHVTYSLQVDQTRDYVLLQPNHNSVNSFTGDNWDYDFFYSIASEPQAMRWRVVVTSGEGVLVTVRNHRCPLQATWSKEIWCDADYFDRPWMCDIEIPTRAAHPNDQAFFVSAYGKNVTYSIAFWRGRENCHDFVGSGRNEGLDFCAGLVPYSTWRWENYQNLDQEAKCFFEDLYQHFRVQPCYSGVTPECNATLQSFACQESFRRCDSKGFYTGTCRDSCEAVVYECANWFETVDLEHYNCTSSRYIDGNAQVCAGNSAFAHFDTANENFLGEEPNVLLFKSSPSSSSSSSILGVSVILTFVLSLFALIF